MAEDAPPAYDPAWEAAYRRDHPESQQNGATNLQSQGGATSGGGNEGSGHSAGKLETKGSPTLPSAPVANVPPYPPPSGSYSGAQPPPGGTYPQPTAYPQPGGPYMPSGGPYPPPGDTSYPPAGPGPYPTPPGGPGPYPAPAGGAYPPSYPQSGTGPTLESAYPPPPPGVQYPPPPPGQSYPPAPPGGYHPYPPAPEPASQQVSTPLLSSQIEITMAEPTQFPDMILADGQRGIDQLVIYQYILISYCGSSAM